MAKWYDITGKTLIVRDVARGSRFCPKIIVDSRELPDITVNKPDEDVLLLLKGRIEKILNTEYVIEIKEYGVVPNYKVTTNKPPENKPAETTK